MQLANLFKFSDENKKFAVNILTFLIIFGFIMLMQFAMHTGPESFNPFSAGWNGLGGNFLMSTLLSNQISSLGLEIKKRILPKRMLSHKQKNLIEFKEKVEVGMRNKNYTESQIFALKKMIATYTDDIEHGNQNNASRIKSLEIAINNLLSIKKDPRPLLTKGPYIEDKILRLMGEYSEQFQRQILTYTQDLFIRMNGSHSLNMNILNYHDSFKKITPLYLVGPPGVGKTRFIEHLAKIFDISMCNAEINIKDTETYQGSYSYYGNEVKCGILADALIMAQKEQKSGFAILFIDEIDKIFRRPSGNSWTYDCFNSWLHKVLEGSIKEIYTRLFNCNIFISNIIIVMAGNKKMGLDKNGKLEPELKSLVSRIKYIEFPHLSQQAKLNIANKYLKNKLKKYKVEVTANDFATLQELVNSNHLPGVRKLLQQVDRYVNFVISQKVLHDWKTKPNEYKIPKAGWLEAKHKNEILSKVKQHKDNQDKVKLKKSYSSPDLLKVS